MQTKGWRVMRIVLSEIDEDLDAVVEAIALELAQPGSRLSYGARFLIDVPTRRGFAAPTSPPAGRNYVP